MLTLVRVHCITLATAVAVLIPSILRPPLLSIPLATPLGNDKRDLVLASLFKLDLFKVGLAVLTWKKERITTSCN